MKELIHTVPAAAVILWKSQVLTSIPGSSSVTHTKKKKKNMRYSDCYLKKKKKENARLTAIKKKKKGIPDSCIP
jgi:hypothetical protein